MRSLILIPSLLFPLCSLLTGCFIANGSDAKRAACNQLKSQIVFNAATSDTRRAEIEKAERPLDEYSYDRNCER